MAILSMPGRCAPEDDSPGLFSYENLYRAYLACRRGKRNTPSALAFEARQELNLLELQAELSTRAYRPAPSACFVTTRPKLREIFAADFRDRIVHHLLVGELEPDWERIFVHDSYACRTGKGVHAGVERLQHFLLQASANGTGPAWYLQLDVPNYFMSIDKVVLWDLLAPRIRDPEVAWLTRVLVDHDCTEGFVYQGKPGLLERVPPHKSLLRCPPATISPAGPVPVLRIALDPAGVADLQATLASYLGHLRWADTRRLTATLPRRYPLLRQDFVIDPRARHLARRLPGRCPGRTVRAQYVWWRRRFPGDALFFQVGRYVELYQGRDRALAERLALAPLRANRRGARWGFPACLLPRYLAAALAAGWAVTVLAQEPLRGGIARRAPVARYLPAAVQWGLTPSIQGVRHKTHLGSTWPLYSPRGAP